MIELPIPCNADMVRAILAGRKTQMRRLVKQQCDHGGAIAFDGQTLTYARTNEYTGEHVTRHAMRSPFGQPGDQLWMRTPYRVSYDAARNQADWHGPSGCGMWVQTRGVPLRQDGKPMVLGDKANRLGRKADFLSHRVNRLGNAANTGSGPGICAGCPSPSAITRFPFYTHHHNQGNPAVMLIRSTRLLNPPDRGIAASA